MSVNASYYPPGCPPELTVNALADLLIGIEPEGAENVQVESLGPLSVRGQARVGRLLMTHGAGAGLDSAMLVAFRQALSEQGVQTLGVEFSYLRQMREEGRRRPPPRVERLVDELALGCDILSQASRVTQMPFWLGGKSMGGRVASMLAARDGAAGLVLCGYPFHPPKRPDRLRLDHWPGLRCPVLVLQGTRDPFGNRDEVSRYELPAVAQVQWLEDGDHDWKPRRASGRNQAELISEAATHAAAFMAEHARKTSGDRQANERAADSVTRTDAGKP